MAKTSSTKKIIKRRAGRVSSPSIRISKGVAHALKAEMGMAGFVDRQTFANTMENAMAQRTGTERMQAVGLKTSVVKAEGGVLKVPVDGTVRLHDRETIVEYMTDQLENDPTACADLALASNQHEAFWNIVWHVGGPTVIHACGNSVFTSLKRLCPPDLVEAAAKELDKRPRRAKRQRG